MSLKWPSSYNNVSLCSGRSEVVELVQRNNVTHASERQHSKNVAPGDVYLVTLSTAMWGILFVIVLLLLLNYYNDSAWCTCHCNLVVLIRNRTIRAYFVVVISNALWKVVFASKWLDLTLGGHIWQIITPSLIFYLLKYLYRANTTHKRLYFTSQKVIVAHKLWLKGCVCIILTGFHSLWLYLTDYSLFNRPHLLLQAMFSLVVSGVHRISR